MSGRKNPMTICGAVLFALGAAACGGGGGGTTTSGSSVDVAALFAAAQDARDQTADAVEAAERAVEDAMEYAAMLDTLSVGGDSMTAIGNARKVLDAETAADRAVMGAEAALQAARDAKAEAEALPSDHTNRGSLIAALDAAIGYAEERVEAVREQAEGMALEAAVAAVEGTDTNNPRGPVSHGEAVATAVAGALGPMGGNDGRGARVEFDYLGAAVPDGAVEMDDRQGMSWAAIVGEANLTDMRISMTGGGTRPVKAASVAGTDASAAIPVNTPANAVTNGTEFTNAVNGSVWQGIAGTVFCASSDCEVSSGGLLTGGWYFTPDLPGEPYVAADDGMGYLRETLYARFGHWLTVDAGSGETTVHAYASTAAMGDPALGAPAGDLTDGSASYAGKAAGMSVHMTFDDQGARTGISSGAFTADVSLTARFGTSPTVSGTVSGFEGNAVDPGWSVDLGEAVLSGSIEAGEARGTGQAGEWTARAYGETDQRPTGILGGFNAHFTDGHAAGAYATRKQ